MMHDIRNRHSRETARLTKVIGQKWKIAILAVASFLFFFFFCLISFAVWFWWPSTWMKWILIESRIKATCAWWKNFHWEMKGSLSMLDHTERTSQSKIVESVIVSYDWRTWSYTYSQNETLLFKRAAWKEWKDFTLHFCFFTVIWKLYIV